MKNRLVRVFFDFQPLFWVLVLGNVFSAGYGYVAFYGEQLRATPWYFWVFVPDCPLSSSLFVVAILLVKYRIHSDLLCMLVIANSVKYALWTVLAIPLYGELFLNPLYPAIRNTNLALVGLHMIMGLQSLLLYPFIKRWRIWHVGIIAIWLYLHDLFDYGLSLYPLGHRHLLAHPYGYLPGASIDHRFFIILAHNLAVSTAFVLFFWWKTAPPRPAGTPPREGNNPALRREAS